MAITVIPTRTDGSAGRSKSNARAVTNLNNEIPAAEWNTVAQAVCDIAGTVGLSDGSTPGSVIEEVNDHEVRITALEAVTTTSRHTAGVVVGISTAGDTSSMCDYLDTGNGAQLQVAITAAAAAGKDVWVRPGTINLAAGPISIPSASIVRFSGKTVIQPSATDRRALICGSSCRVYNAYINYISPSLGATGSIGVQVDFGAVLTDLTIIMSYTYADIVNESLRFAVKDAGVGVAIILDRPFIQMWPFETLGLPQDITDISITAVTGGMAAQIISPTLLRGDVGIEAYGNVIISDANIHSCRRRGMLLGSDVSGGPSIYCSPKAIGGTVKLNPNTEECIGVEVVTGNEVTGAFGILIQNLDICLSGALVATSAGVRLNGIGKAPMVQNCTIDAFPVGIDGSSTQTYANVTGNVVRSLTPVITVLGTGSNISNNILFT